MRYRTDYLYGCCCRSLGWLPEEASQTGSAPCLRPLFEQALPRAAADALAGLPAEWLDNARSFADSPLRHDGSGCGQILLPGDFMRLVSFRLEGWARAVRSLTDAGSPLYALQRQGVAGLRGSAARPVCTLVQTNCGQALEYHDGSTEPLPVAEALYAPRPEVQRDGTIDLPSAALADTLRRCRDILMSGTH